jgi:hypothetical protein
LYLQCLHSNLWLVLNAAVSRAVGHVRKQDDDHPSS